MDYSDFVYAVSQRADARAVIEREARQAEQRGGPRVRHAQRALDLLSRLDDEGRVWRAGRYGLTASASGSAITERGRAQYLWRAAEALASALPHETWAAVA